MNRPDTFPIAQEEDRPRFSALVVLAGFITLFALGSNVAHEFVDWDDIYILPANAKFNPPTWRSILGFAVVRNADANIYIPITDFFWGLLAVIGHTDHPDARGSLLNPWVFHAASLCVHLASVGMVFAIIRELTGSVAAWFGAVVFAIPIMLIAHRIQPALWQTDNPVLARPVVALDALSFYITKIIAPVHLILDYGRTPRAALAPGWRWIWLVPPVIGVFLIWKGKRFFLLVGGCLLAVAGIAPLLGFFPFAAQDYSTVSDHYLYPSMLGVALVAAFLYQEAKRKFSGPAVMAAALVIIGAMGVQSFAVSDMWSNGFSLFARELSTNPQSSSGHTGLATALAASGDMPDAEEHYRAAVQFNRHNGMALMGLANILLQKADLDGAAAQYEGLIAVYKLQSNFDPKLGAGAELVIAARLIRRGDQAGALAALDQAKSWDPDNPQLDALFDRARASASTHPATSAHAAY